MKKLQSGNALWLILLGIFLLGALTVVLSRTGRQTEETGSTEQVSLEVSKLLNYAALIDGAVKSLLAKGCSENEINFYDPDNSLDHTNPNAPSDGSCDVFKVSGAGIKSKKAPGKWNITSNDSDWSYIGSKCYYGIGNGTTTCLASELELVAKLNTLTLEMCKAINARLGVPDVSGAVPADDDGGAAFNGTFVTGSYGPTMMGDTGSATGVPLRYKNAACLMDNGGSGVGNYNFYKVLIAR